MWDAGNQQLAAVCGNMAALRRVTPSALSPALCKFPKRQAASYTGRVGTPQPEEEEGGSGASWKLDMSQSSVSGMLLQPCSHVDTHKACTSLNVVDYSSVNLVIEKDKADCVQSKLAGTLPWLAVVLANPTSTAPSPHTRNCS